MRIVRPYALMMSSGDLRFSGFSKGDGIHLLRRIEWAARISHRSEEEQGEQSWERFIRFVVLQHGDWSVVEHSSVSVDFYVDRGITHELVRHRLFGFTQESTRFVNYEKKMPAAFIYPKPDVECPCCIRGEAYSGSKGGSYVHGEGEGTITCAYDMEWVMAISHVESVYRELLRKGWRPQEARSVFPNALASRIVITGNLRNWRHFFLMRTSKEAHPQMRQVTIPLLKEFQEKIPILYEDIIPDARQVDNIAKGR